MAEPQTFRPSPLRYAWGYLPLLSALGCAGVLAYVALLHGGPADARLFLGVSAAVGVCLALSAFGSVVGGEGLLAEESPAEPLKLREAGWMLGAPIGVLAGAVLVLSGPVQPHATFFQAFAIPLVVATCLAAVLWTTVGRVLARQAQLTLGDYACALFMSPEAYAVCKRRKQAWQAAQHAMALKPAEAVALAPEIVMPLAERLESTKRADEAQHIMDLIEEIGTADIEPAVLEALQHASPKVRGAATVLAGQLGMQEAAPLLAQRVLEEQDRAARRSAVVALGKMEATLALPVLQSALQDKAPGVRESACVALTRLGAVHALPLIETLKKDSSPIVRAAAQRAIARLSGPEQE